MPIGGLLLFLLSCTGLIAVSWLASRRLALCGGDRAWIALALAVLLLGSISITASLFRMYTPAGFLGMQVIASAALLGAAGVIHRRRPPVERDGGQLPDPAAAEARVPFTAGEWGLIAAIVLLLGLSAVERFLLPLFHGDELMYHASRAGYWVQAQSVFPYDSHNDRQTTFPFGAELFFAWPLLFTRWDLPGQMLHWLSVPLGTVGVFSVARVAGATRPACFFAALLYAATPAVLTRAFQLKSDIWTPVFVLGAAWFAARAAERPSKTIPLLFWAGVLTALAINIKVTVGTMVLALGALPLLLLPRRKLLPAELAIGAGGLLGALLSGLAVLLIANAINTGHPLGPEYLRKIVQPEFSLRQTWTHIVRVPMYLIEFPDNPAAGLQHWIKDTGDDAIDWLGAGEPLPQEANDSEWPGILRTSRYATRFSLGGMLWLPLLAVGVVILGRELARTVRGGGTPEFASRPALSPLGALVLIELPLFAGVVFLIRWMGGGPERFWLAPYALSLAISLTILSRWRGAGPLLGAAAIIGACAVTYPSAAQLVGRVDRLVSKPMRPSFRLQDAIDRIPPGSTILLLGSWNIQDYPLMAPEGRLVNRVVLWGKADTNPQRLEHVLQSEGIEYVLIERERLWFGTPPPTETAPVVQYLEQRPGVTPLDVPPPVRLFAIDPAAGAEAPVPAPPAHSEARP